MYRNSYLYFLTYVERDFEATGHLLMASQDALDMSEHPHAVELAKRIVSICPISSMLASYELTTLAVCGKDKLGYTEVSRKSAEEFLMSVMQRQEALKNKEKEGDEDVKDSTEAS